MTKSADRRFFVFPQRTHVRASNVVIQNSHIRDLNEEKRAAARNAQLIDKQVKLTSGATYTVCKPAYAGALETESSE